MGLPVIKKRQKKNSHKAFVNKKEKQSNTQRFQWMVSLEAVINVPKNNRKKRSLITDLLVSENCKHEIVRGGMTSTKCDQPRNTPH